MLAHDLVQDLLAALLERLGELVTREELRGKLWPADTFVDFDHSLNAAIKRLRAQIALRIRDLLLVTGLLPTGGSGGLLAPI
jgi:DNA-binding response OmpR family regulator